jgi:hypothetical protein
MKKLLNAEYLFSAKTPTGIVTVSVYIYYHLGKYAINEPTQEGVFWGDRDDVVADSIKAKLIHTEIMPFLAEQFNFAVTKEGEVL